MTARKTYARLPMGGFTLIELLVVIAIIATLLAIASLQTRSMLDRNAVEGEIKSLHSDLLQARVRATQRNRIHFVQFAATTYTITEDTNPAPDGDGIRDAGDAQFLQRQLDAKFPLVWLGGGGPLPLPVTISINSKGLIDTSQAGVVRLTIPVLESGEYDCVQISEIRTVAGKWDGANCIAK